MKTISLFFALIAALFGSAAPVIPQLPKENAEEMLSFYRDAADHGSPKAMLVLAHYNEHGIGMPVNREEAVRLYDKICGTRGAERDGILDEAVRGLERLGGTTVAFDEKNCCGNALLDLIGAQTNDASALFTTRFLKLKSVGRTLVFTNLVASYVQRLKDGGVNLLLDPPDETRGGRDPHQRVRFGRSCRAVRVLFDDRNAKLARCLDREDKILRLEGTVVTNCPWHMGFVLRGISVTPEDPTAADPLPAFDAASITGDELTDYFSKHRHIRKWQFAEIQSKLAGRRLTFHKLRLSGNRGSRGNKFDETFWVGAVPRWVHVGEGDQIGKPDFKLTFGTEAARQYARHLVEQVGFVVTDEVTGTFAKVDDPDQGWALQLEDVKLVPHGTVTDLPCDENGVLSGDEIVRKVGSNFSQITKLSICAQYAGREIGFTSGVVESCRPDPDNGSLDLVCRLSSRSSDSGVTHPLLVGFNVSADKARTLRRTPIPGDLVLGPRGRLSGSPTDRPSRRSSGFTMLELENPDFGMTWKSDIVKTNGLETKTGQRIVRRLALCWQEVRADQFLRLARQLDGKAVDFACARSQHSVPQNDGTVLVRVRLEDPLLGPCVDLDVIVSESALAEKVSLIKYGTLLRNLHGVLTVKTGRRNEWESSDCRVRLKDATFEIVPPAVTKRRD